MSISESGTSSSNHNQDQNSHGNQSYTGNTNGNSNKRRKTQQSLNLNELLTVDKEPRKYELMICQQPKSARMSSFGERDRRPLDPPPILQLKIYDKYGKEDNDAIRSPFWVVHVLLDNDQHSLPKPPSQILQGSLTSSAHYVKYDNLLNRFGCFFYFSDLTLTTEGIFRLKFLLTTVCALPNMSPNQPLPVLIETLTDPFTVYTAKKFPGMTPSSSLAKSLAYQGIKIPVRNEERGKQKHKSDDQDNQ